MKRRGPSFTKIFQLPKHPHQEPHAVLFKKTSKSKVEQLSSFRFSVYKNSPSSGHVKKEEKGDFKM